MAAHQQGNLNAALAGYTNAVAIAPGNVTALGLLGVVCLQMGRRDEARVHLTAALNRDSRNIGARLHLAMLLMSEGLPAEAGAHLRRVLKQDASNVDALFALGNACAQQRHFEDAAANYKAVLRHAPTHVDAAINYGNVLCELGRAGEAVAIYGQVLARVPNHPFAALNRARALADSGQASEAEAAYRAILAAQPHHAGAWNGLGLTLLNAGHLPQAEAALRAAVREDPARAAEIARSLATVVQQLGRRQEAFGLWKQAVGSADPAMAVPAWSEFIATAQELCAWDELDGAGDRVYRMLAAGWHGINPGALLRSEDDPTLHLAAARLYCDNFPRQGRKHRVKPKDRLTIGYLSPDLREHPVSYLLAGVIERHDRGRFRVVALSCAPDDHSAMRQRMETAFDEFIDVTNHSDADLAATIQAAGIDILVEMAGHTTGSRLGVLGRRPAPVQASWLGYPGTTGADFVDYLIGDPVVTPSSAAEHYVETLVRLPLSYLPSDPNRPCPETVAPRNSFGLPDHGVVFCAFNQPAKLTRRMLLLWAQLLRQLPDSVLWLTDGGDAVREAICREMGVAGVSVDRVVFAGKLPQVSDHLARYLHADVFLDSSPYGAHTTASDALWMGCPVVTLPGASFASRVGAGLLTALGLPELIAADAEDYVAIAHALASDPERRFQLRSALSNVRWTAPLFDASRFTRDLEAAYVAMWECCLAGDRPQAIAIGG